MSADPLLRQLRARLRNDTVTMDVSDLRFIRPAHLVGIAAKAHRAHQRGLDFVLIGPDNDDVASYAARMRLDDALDSVGALHTLSRGRSRNRRSDLLEVTQINTADDVERLARLVYDKVVDTSRRRAAALHKSLGELGSNVIQHAGSAGFLAAQTMPTLSELRLAVGDGGHGLKATLHALAPADDGEAIALALTGASRFKDPTRGTGLPSTLEAIRDLHGTLYIGSGQAAMNVSRSAGRPREGSARFRGTLIEAKIPLP